MVLAPILAEIYTCSISNFRMILSVYVYLPVLVLVHVYTSDFKSQLSFDFQLTLRLAGIV